MTEVNIMYINEEEARRASKGVKYSEDHAALVIWSLKKTNRSHSFEQSDLNLMGSLIVERVKDTSNKEVATRNAETRIFTLAVTRREKKIMDELHMKYEKVLAAYNEEIRKRMKVENELARYRGQQIN